MREENRLSELADGLALPDRVTFKGTVYDLEPLTFTDAAEIQRELGHTFLDPTNGEHQQLMLHLVLRRSDPRLSEDQKRKREWLLTREEAGETISLRDATTPEGQAFLRKVFEMSGLVMIADEPEAEEETEGNAPAPEAPKTRKTRRASGASSPS